MRSAGNASCLRDARVALPTSKQDAGNASKHAPHRHTGECPLLVFPTVMGDG
jgi:hypothetical protein